MGELKKSEKDWILSMRTEQKKMLMREMLKENKIGEYFQFIKVLLDAPILSGGMSTDDINEVYYGVFPDSQIKFNKN